MKTLFAICLLMVQIPALQAQVTYVFQGNGAWSNASNWRYKLIPHSILPSGSMIYFATKPGDSCILDVNQQITSGAILNTNSTPFYIAPGVNLDVTGTVNIAPKENTVLICDREFTTRNLEVTTYRNGDPIPYISDATAWRNATYGAYCYMNNDPSNAAIYGPLYNWHAVNDPRGLAPVGWHIPSETEWTDYFACLGGWAEAGGRMKETGLANWTSPNAGANNESGFTGLPGGYRNQLGVFGNFTGFGYFWSTTPNATEQAWHCYLSYTNAQVSQGFFEKTWGFSVRCVKDY